MSEEELVKKVEVISAVRGYESRGVRRRAKEVDFMVSPSGSDDKILIRVITGSKSRSEYVGVDTVKEMSEVLKKQRYDKGILVGKRFTKGAESEMERENIEAFSERITPHFKLERLYLVVNGCVDNLCRARCGLVPMEESDCKGYIDGHYACDVRLVSDNASFHFERGWIDFLERDLARLLAIGKA